MFVLELEVPEAFETWGRTHDVVMELFGIDLTVAQCIELFRVLPHHIQGEAVAWGFSDTCYGDMLYEHLRDHDGRKTVDVIVELDRLKVKPALSGVTMYDVDDTTYARMC